MALFETKEKFIEWLNSEEGAQIGGKVFDSKFATALKKYQENHPDKAQLGPRLDSIEAKLNEKDIQIKNNELKFFAFKKCTENNINFELLNGYPLTDEKQIEEKILQLGTLGKITETRLINERFANLSKKPELGQQRDTSSRKTMADYALEAEERELNN